MKERFYEYRGLLSVDSEESLINIGGVTRAACISEATLNIENFYGAQSLWSLAVHPIGECYTVYPLGDEEFAPFNSWFTMKVVEE